MALSATFRYVMQSLAKNGMLPRGGSLLEIGEANWYGTLDRDLLVGEFSSFTDDPREQQKLTARIDAILTEQAVTSLFDMAKLFYEVTFAPAVLEAIDYGGSAIAHRMDLNLPVKLSRQFDITINHGTAEHIFRVAQVFETMHEYTLPGGLMFHESPFTGWIDHGFYNLHPTLFYDLADFNKYGIYGVFIEDLKANSLLQLKGREDVLELAKSKEIPDNSMLLVVFQKAATESPFKVPLQGYYRKGLSDKGMKAWSELR